MSNSLIYDRSVNFSLKVIDVYRWLMDECHEYVLSKQLLRSATSIGANIKEANSAQSKKDFLSKMYIAFKESSETEYWLILLYKSNYIDKLAFDTLYNECKIINNILGKITLTTKRNLNINS